MTNKTILLLIVIVALFVSLLAALVFTAVLLIKNRRGKKNRMSRLNMPLLTGEEKKILRKKGGYTGSVKALTTSEPEVTAKIIKSWVTGDE